MKPAQDGKGLPAENPAGAPAEDMEDMDPGLARERTELAWTRTAISFAALGGAVLKVTPVVGVLILALSGLVWEIGRLARRAARAAGPAAGGPGGAAPPGGLAGRGRRGAVPPGWQRPGQRHMLLLITIAVTAVSLVALVVTVLAAGRSPLTVR